MARRINRIIHIQRVTDPGDTAELFDILHEYLNWNRDEMLKLGLPDIDPGALVA